MVRPCFLRGCLLGLCLASRPRGGACTSAFVEGLLATARPGRDRAAVLRASSARGPMGQARQRHKPSALPVGSGLRTNRSIAERKSRPATRRDRVRQESGLNDRHARAKHLGLLSQLARPRAAPGGHTARASSRRCPLLDTRAAAPGGVLRSTTQSSLLGAAPRPPWSRRSSATGSRPTSTSSRAGPASRPSP